MDCLLAGLVAIAQADLLGPDSQIFWGNVMRNILGIRRDHWETSLMGNSKLESHGIFGIWKQPRKMEQDGIPEIRPACSS